MRGPPAGGANRLRAFALPLCPASHGGAQNNIHRSRRWEPRQEGGLAGCFPTRRAPPPPPHAPGLQRPPLPPTPRATSLQSPIPLQKLQKFEETFQDPSGDPSGHLVHRAGRKRCALGVTPAPNICSKVPSSGLPKAPLQMCTKGPPCLPSPAWPRAPNVCESLPKSRATGAPFQSAQGLKKPSTVCYGDPFRPFAKGLPRCLRRGPFPQVSKSCSQSRPLAKSFSY